MTHWNFEDELLPTEWKLMRIGDVKSDEPRAIITGPFGSNISSKFFVEEGVPVIRGNNLLFGRPRFVDEGFVFVTPKKAKELNAWAKRNDIVLTAAGTLGQIGLIEGSSKFSKYVISNKQMRLRVNTNIVRPLFAFYWLSTPRMIKYIEQLNTGSTIPLINLSILRNLPIVVPPLEEQDAIIEVLDKIDSKIKVNQQINLLLENVGKAVFRRWFVNFEFPDEEGKPYNSSGGKMVCNDVLEKRIPKDWNVKKLGDFIKLDKGLSYKGAFLCSHGLPMINLGTIHPKSGFLPKGIKYYNGEYKERHLVKAGDIVIANTDITQKREVLGTPVIVPPNLNSEKALFTHHIFAVRKKSNLPNLFIYYLLQLHEYRCRVRGFATGTTVLALPKDAILNFEFAAPDERSLRAFNNFASLLVAKINSNNEVTQQLTLIRDRLLPKLMSGKIRVSVTEKNARFYDV